MSMAGTSVNEVKLSLKIMVDTKARKVVFAEAGSEFVDFLFDMLSLSLATVVKLVSNEEMSGSLPAVYNSAEALSAEYFEKSAIKDNVLMKFRVHHPLLAPNPHRSSCISQSPRYVKKAVPYIVMDNLQVKLMSMTLLKSLVSDDHLVEKDVEFGLKEALTLLRASLSTNNVLTTVFLGIKKEIM